MKYTISQHDTASLLLAFENAYATHKTPARKADYVGCTAVGLAFCAVRHPMHVYRGCCHGMYTSTAVFVEMLYPDACAAVEELLGTLKLSRLPARILRRLPVGDDRVRVDERNLLREEVIEIQGHGKADPSLAGGV
jgi:hypothetical protein